MKKRELVIAFIALFCIVSYLGFVLDNSFGTHSSITGNAIGVDSQGIGCIQIASNGAQTATSLVADWNRYSPNLALYPEMPPKIVTTGAGSRIYIPTAWTYSFPYSPGNNFITNFNGFNTNSLNNPRLAFGGNNRVDNRDINNPVAQNLQFSTQAILASQNLSFWNKWHFASHSLEFNGTETLAFNHGEQGVGNISYTIGTTNYVNIYTSDIHPEIPYDHNIDYSQIWDCRLGYVAFITMSHTQRTDGVGFVDAGPIVWPTTGYPPCVSSPLTMNDGVRHPGSIIANGYIYLFYQSNTNGLAANAEESGIKVARAPVSGGGQPGTFKSWYKINGVEGWDASLPQTWTSHGVSVTENGTKIYSAQYAQHFSQGQHVIGGEVWNSWTWDSSFGGQWMWKVGTDNGVWINWGNGYMTRTDSKRGFSGFDEIDSYGIKGGKASNIFNADWNVCNMASVQSIQSSNSFQVAKIKNTNYYFGVEEGQGWYGPNNYYALWIALRLSTDLVHWSDPTILPDTVYPWPWGNQYLTYATPLSADFSSNKEIDANDFYIIGQHPSSGNNEQTYFKRMKILLPSSACVDKECDNTPANGFVDAGKSCQGIFSTEYTSNIYHNILQQNIYLGNEWLYYNQSCTLASTAPCNPPIYQYYISPNCTLGTYGRYVWINPSYNATAAYVWGSNFNCNQIGTDYCAPIIQTCTSFTYSSWSTCSSSGTQTRTIASSSPTGCSGGSPILSQSCTYIPLCTDSDWSYSLSPTTCPSTSQQTKTWSKSGSCSGGVSHPTTETISCTYNAPVCTYSYSDWGACQSSGTQTRTYTSSPSGCQGTPITSQSCNYVPECTDSDWSYSLSPTTCPNTQQQTKTWAKSGTCSGGTSHPITETISCTYNAPVCSYSYFDWSNCSQSEVQTRTFTSSPSGCQGTPITSQSCTYIPACTESNWNFSINPSVCPSNQQQNKSWNKIGNCNGGTSHVSSEIINCTYIANIVACTNFSYSDWSDCLQSGVRTRQINSSSPEGCAGGNPIVSETCDYVSPAATGGSGGGGTSPVVTLSNTSNSANSEPSINSSGTENIIKTENKQQTSGAIKTFFVKLICRISNLFDNNGYETCKLNYLS